MIVLSVMYEKTEDSMKKALFKIDGMSCGGCVNAVNRAIQSVEGVLNQEVSLEDGKATVEFDEQRTNEEAILQALQQTPYQSELLSVS